MLAPGSLYLFATPEDLEDGQAWVDTPAGGAAMRQFSGGFCADLLADLGASRVVCLDASPLAIGRCKEVERGSASPAPACARCRWQGGRGLRVEEGFCCA